MTDGRTDGRADAPRAPPADRPTVAFCVLVEGQLDTNTWGGKTAGPVVKQMLETWAGTGERPAAEPSR